MFLPQRPLLLLCLLEVRRVTRIGGSRYPTYAPLGYCGRTNQRSPPRQLVRKSLASCVTIIPHAGSGNTGEYRHSRLRFAPPARLRRTMCLTPPLLPTLRLHAGPSRPPTRFSVFVSARRGMSSTQHQYCADNAHSSS
ncbi:hypothetical protein C8J57DRAFT_686690 [Mycena rebaudengoi]|nr:hypothetical protein C8J57DRAFT_686690 [Mycena rebaudengoi]